MQNTTQFLFFSENQAELFTASARKIIAYAGDSFLRLYQYAYNYIDLIESRQHRIIRNDAVNLMALLGSAMLSSDDADTVRTEYGQCTEILAAVMHNQEK